MARHVASTAADQFVVDESNYPIYRSSGLGGSGCRSLSSIAVIFDSRHVPAETMELRSEAEEYVTLHQEFPKRVALVSATRFHDGTWVASLADDDTVFSDGESLDDARANLIASARDDLDILREYGTRVEPHLAQKRELLEDLFG